MDRTPGFTEGSAKSYYVCFRPAPVGKFGNEIRAAVKLEPQDIVIMVQDREAPGVKSRCQVLRQRRKDLRVLAFTFLIVNDAGPVEIREIGLPVKTAQLRCNMICWCSDHGNVRIKVPHKDRRTVCSTLFLRPFQTQIGLNFIFLRHRDWSLIISNEMKPPHKVMNTTGKSLLYQ